ncbi:MAG: hypothetical protein ABIF71_09645 [Planctomycetota bacterium]
MSQMNGANEPATDKERSHEQVPACGSGCSCNAKPSGRARWVVGAIVVVIAGVLVARAVLKSDRVSGQKADADFTTLAVAGSAAQSSDNASMISTSAAIPNAIPAQGAQPVSPDAAANRTAVAAAEPGALNVTPKTTAIAAPPDAGNKTADTTVVCGELIQSLKDRYYSGADIWWNPFGQGTYGIHDLTGLLDGCRDD